MTQSFALEMLSHATNNKVDTLLTYLKQRKRHRRFEEILDGADNTGSREHRYKNIMAKMDPQIAWRGTIEEISEIRDLSLSAIHALEWDIRDILAKKPDDIPEHRYCHAFESIPRVLGAGFTHADGLDTLKAIRILKKLGDALKIHCPISNTNLVISYGCKMRHIDNGMGVTLYTKRSCVKPVFESLTSNDVIGIIRPLEIARNLARFGQDEYSGCETLHSEYLELESNQILPLIECSIDFGKWDDAANYIDQIRDNIERYPRVLGGRHLAVEHLSAIARWRSGKENGNNTLKKLEMVYEAFIAKYTALHPLSIGIYLQMQEIKAVLHSKAVNVPPDIVDCLRCHPYWVSNVVDFDTYRWNHIKLEKNRYQRQLIFIS